MSPPRPHSSGFTLVEILASSAVLSLLLVVIMQTVGAVSNTWRLGVSRADNLTNARAVLTLIDRDIQSMVLRPDLAAFVDDHGQPACAFYSKVYGGDGERRLSLVAYSNAGHGVDRADFALDYADKVLTLNETDRFRDLANAHSERFVDGAIRFECQFVTAAGELKDAFAFDFENPEAPTNTRVVVVSLLVLDNGTAQVAEKAGLFPALSAEFASPPPPGSTHAKAWSTKTDQLPAHYPQPVRSGLRVFERSISIPCP